ncbi:DUF4163 domain-containing protein [Paenibacillus sp. DMB20]|uniref:DUF4163 domain-containing protein n=1 Tax=Paenibacillus sp. DMB20 TaxID=1642570 RepID=UPI001F3AF826|nr:DUF4163 domain-containing protein [Paenibacillus sp. DMB20]
MTTFKSVSPFQKKLVAAGLAGALLLTGSAGFVTEVHAGSPAARQSSPIVAKIQELLTHKTLKSGESSLKTSIRIPVFHGLKDAKYQAQLNGIIESHASKDLARWEKEAKEGALKAKKNAPPCILMNLTSATKLPRTDRPRFQLDFTEGDHRGFDRERSGPARRHL